MKKRKTIINIITALIVSTLVLGVYIYGYSLLDKIKYNKLPDTDEELGITPLPVQGSGVPNTITVPNTVSTPNTVTVPNTVTDPDTATDPDTVTNPNTVAVTNIALFGLDRRNPDEASRSDTIMVVSLDKNNKKIKITSLMRDMYVPIPGKKENRINAAYAFGDAPLAIRTINSNFGLDIRDYVAVDFIGLEKVIEKVGGIDINVKDYEIPEIEGVSKPGLQSLNGQQVVDYSRIRHVGDADFERTQRQRYVIDLLYQKIRSQGIVKLPGTVSALLPCVETSLSKTEIMELVMEIAQYNTKEIEQLRLPADGCFKSQKIRGMYVLVPDIEANKNLLHDFIYEIED